tara:strand:+ start:466 stop:978 length:513 start_codon:yes stop_codon:yes gene_type:complete
MFGANLSEVWDDYKPKKNKKKKDKPLTPDDMDSGLLLKKREKELMKDERERISGLVDDREIDYRYERINPNVVTFENPYASRFEMKGRQTQKEIPKPMTLEDDPDYKEFLEFKRNKRNKRPILNNKPRIVSKKEDIYDNEQLNELILYIFTGFFLLILYDNIYRLGKKSY